MPAPLRWTREVAIELAIAVVLAILAVILYATIPATRWWATPILIAATIGMLMNAARASRVRE